MKPEGFRRTITLERATYVVDPGSGERIETWGLLGPAKIWANYAPVSDGERIEASQKGATLSARFTIRRDSSWADVNGKDRLVFEGRTFDIWGVKPVEGRRDFIEITAAARSD